MLEDFVVALRFKRPDYVICVLYENLNNYTETAVILALVVVLVVVMMHYNIFYNKSLMQLILITSG